MLSLHSLTSLFFSQTRTEIVEDSRWKVPFVVLASGQEYCAVAQLGPSPVSNPQCIYVPLLGKQCSIQLIFIFIVTIDIVTIAEDRDLVL